MREKTVPARFATEFGIRGKVEERTGWRGQNEGQTGGEEKRNGRLYGVAETSKERAEWRRLQRKNLNILGLPKRKECEFFHRTDISNLFNCCVEQGEFPNALKIAKVVPIFKKKGTLICAPITDLFDYHHSVKF